jgi:hypothetical protein
MAMAESAQHTLRIGDQVSLSWGVATVVGLTRGGEVILKDSTGYLVTVPADQVSPAQAESEGGTC